MRLRLAARFALLVFAVSAGLSAQVQVSQGTDQISVIIDGKAFTAFFYGNGVTKPYLYPLRTASGLELTRHWPMQDKPGDAHDHIHHRGVWFAHADVNGFDFWNSDPSYHNPNMGRIVVSKINDVQSGASAGSIQAELRWLEPDGRELIHESRRMTFHTGDPRSVDFDITITAKEQAKFGDEKDGAFGLRRAAELEEQHGARIAGSNGCHQEAGCWGTRADWMDVSGKIAGADVGVTVLDHPENPHHPTYWHVRGYGLLAANIFGVKAFTHDASADGSVTLAPGQSLRFRYRVVLHEGANGPKPETFYKAWTSAK